MNKETYIAVLNRLKNKFILIHLKLRALNDVF